MRIPYRFTWVVAVCMALASLTLAGCSRDPAVREARYLKRGKEMMAKRDFNHAIVEFNAAIKAMPQDAEAHYQLALALLAANRLPQAAGALMKATQLNPKHAAAQVKLAELMVANRDDETLRKAEERMTGVLADNPDNPDAIRALAIAEFKLGKGEAAEQKLADSLKRFPDNLKSAAAMASMKLARRDLAGAEETLKDAVKQLPRSTEAGLALASFYVSTGKLAQAEAEAARVLTIDGSFAPALLMKAAFEMERGKTDQAEQTYKQIAALPAGTYDYAHAAFLLQQKRFDQAIAEFRGLAAAAPSSREARTRLIQAQLAAGRPQDAERELDAALKKNAKDQDALLQRSRILLAGGRFDAAEKDLRAVIQLAPNSADAHFGLARVLAAAGNDLRMREELGEALRLRPDLLSVRAELCRALISARAAQTALDTMDSAPEFQKSNPEFVIARNWALLALGRAEEARAAVEKALERRSVPELIFQRGVLHLAGKNFAAARADADAVLAANPSHVRALQVAIEARLALKENAQAEDVLRRMTARSPNSPLMQSAAGDAFLVLRKPADARRCYEAALSLAPSYAPASIALARLDAASGQRDAARTRLQKVVEAQPRGPLGLMALADMEYATGNRAQAGDLYRRAAEADRRNVVALNNYAYIRAESDPDGALPFAQKALEAAPESAMVLDTLGWIYYRKGLNELAVSHLEKAMQREPTPRRQFHLGMAQMKIGQKQTGAENLNTALKKDPKLTSTEVGW